MRKGIRRLLQSLGISLAVLLLLFVASYVMIFTTEAGFRIFMGSVADMVKEPGEEECTLFSYETFTKQEFSAEFLNRSYTADEELISALAKEYPPRDTSDRLFVYAHDHELDEQDATQVKCRTVGVSKYTDFVYIIDRWED